MVDSALGSNSLAALREMSAQDLLQSVATSPSADSVFWPNIDGYFLPEPVPAIYAQGKEAQVPLLTGWNRDEATAWILRSPQLPTVETVHALAEKTFGARADDFLRAYPATNNSEALRVEEDFAGDTFIVYSTWAWIEAQAQTGHAPVYRYMFELGSPGDPHHPASSGAFHSDDIEYVFGTLDSRKGATWRPEDYKLSDLMQSYWTNFAKTGNPNAPELPNRRLPDWPTYDAPGKWQVMHLGAKPEAEPDRHRDRYLFLKDVWK
jgi:para-nitrobenzyl esterase